MQEDNGCSRDSSVPRFNLKSFIYPLKSKKGGSKYDHNGPYDFPLGKSFRDIPKFSPEKCYWRYLFNKFHCEDYSKETVSKLIDQKLSKIGDYFKRLEKMELTEKEINKKPPMDYFGCYFPNMKEIEAIRSLNITIYWDAPEEHKSWKSFKGNFRGVFSVAEIECLWRRWKKFQRIYKVYDLRPILGVRCGLYNEETKDFLFFRMVDDSTLSQFIIWMGKELPSLSGRTIFQKLLDFTDKYIEGKFDPATRKQPLTGLELSSIMEIYDRYGFGSHKIMELLIGKRTRAKYLNYCIRYCAIQHIPIKHGAWSKEENLKLLKNILEMRNISDVNELLTKNEMLNLFGLFNNIKTRTVYMIMNQWRRLKSHLYAAASHKNNEKKVAWTNEDYVKLIVLVYKNDAKALRDVNWQSIAKSFTGVADVKLRQKFYFIYASRIPKSIQKYYDESLEYLYHNVIPVYKLKAIKSKKIKEDYSSELELLSNLGNSSALEKFVSAEAEIEDDDEEYAIISEFLNRTPTDFALSHFLDMGKPRSSSQGGDLYEDLNGSSQESDYDEDLDGSSSQESDYDEDLEITYEKLTCEPILKTLKKKKCIDVELRKGTKETELNEVQILESRNDFKVAKSAFNTPSASMERVFHKNNNRVKCNPDTMDISDESEIIVCEVVKTRKRTLTENVGNSIKQFEDGLYNKTTPSTLCKDINSDRESQEFGKDFTKQKHKKLNKISAAHLDCEGNNEKIRIPKEKEIHFHIVTENKGVSNPALVKKKKKRRKKKDSIQDEDSQIVGVFHGKGRLRNPNHYNIRDQLIHPKIKSKYLRKKHSSDSTPHHDLI